jgi:stage V sporulation protein R
MMSQDPSPSSENVQPQAPDSSPDSTVDRELAELRSMAVPTSALTHRLAAQKEIVEGFARAEGLDFFETIFHVVKDTKMNEVAAYGGFPVRYPHWRFGMEYLQLSKGYDYGLQKIYELVINNEPCHAYLLGSNMFVDQKLVMAHVYGHCDFFKNNIYFAQTNRKMLDQMGNHATRVREYIDRYGLDTVEAFIDTCLSIEDLIDIHSPGIKRNGTEKDTDTLGEDELDEPVNTGRFNSKDYMDTFINPPEVLKAERDRLTKERDLADKRFPETPQRDVLLFLIEHAKLEPWQRDVLSIIRDEAYYFAPQGQTKIMNEGWASYWHSTMMTKYLLNDSEVVDYADHHSGTVAMSGGKLNPYKLGIELFRDIEERWNTGRFGPEYENCQDAQKKENWDLKLGLGRQKIFEVRKIHNDITFLDEFLTPEFCKRHKLFSFGHNNQTKDYRIESREFEQIKDRLLRSLTNFGRPIIEVVNANHQNRGELLLKHKFEGTELDLNYATETLKNMYKIWSRPVYVETVVDEQKTQMGWDGTSFTKRTV